MSPQVDFYITDKPEKDAKERLACRIAEKGYLNKNKVYIHTSTQAQLTVMDDMLWTFRQGSFIPHSDKPEDELPVTLGCDEESSPNGEVLINLGHTVPTFIGNFDRVIEIITSQGREEGRDRYRFYQKHEYKIENHNV